MSTATVCAYIGLGSNLDDPQKQLKSALTDLARLPNTQLTATSSFFQSKPVGPDGQPDYINAVAQLHTQLSPHELLSALQNIENAHGRVRHERWGARTLDLDVLLFGDITSSDPVLTIPHPYLDQRNFVLYPLFAIAPQLRLPDGRMLEDLIKSCPDDGLIRL